MCTVIGPEGNGEIAGQREVMRVWDAMQRQAARAMVQDSWKDRAQAIRDQEWGRVVGISQKQVDAVNQRIADFNLEAPALGLHLVPLDLEREIAAASQSPPDSGAI